MEDVGRLLRARAATAYEKIYVCVYIYVCMRLYMCAKSTKVV